MGDHLRERQREWLNGDSLHGLAHSGRSYKDGWQCWWHKATFLMRYKEGVTSLPARNLYWDILRQHSRALFEELRWFTLPLTRCFDKRSLFVWCLGQLDPAEPSAWDAVGGYLRLSEEQSPDLWHNPLAGLVPRCSGGVYLVQYCSVRGVTDC